ncbi:MAG TPA: hypothetical protein PK874_04620 [Desulfobacteraceae bacterium]|nr:hypothetical protein [Desulfobacteraceae bacterium]HPQ29427.1 hypothetical protein [Desulfobacteraceae bacterium]
MGAQTHIHEVRWIAKGRNSNGARPFRLARAGVDRECQETIEDVGRRLTISRTPMDNTVVKTRKSLGIETELQIGGSSWL